MSAENITRPGGPQAGRDVALMRVMLIAFVLALVIRALVGMSVGAAQPQEIRYVTIAQGILSGQGFNGLDGRFPDIIQPPLFPLLLSVVFRLPGTDLAMARALNCLIGAALVFPAGAIAHRLFGGRTAARSVLLVAVYPLLSRMSAAAVTEALFGTMICSAAFLVWRALDREGSTTWGALLPFLPAGILFGLGFLTRPEALAYLGIASALLFLAAGLQREGVVRAAKGTMLMVSGFIVFVAPYMIWVHGKTGEWMLSPKAAHVQVNHGLVQKGQREQWKEPYGSELFFEHVKFGLNDDDTAIRSQEEFGSIRTNTEEKASLFRPGMAISMFTRNLKEVYLHTIKYGYVIPSILLVLGGVGLLSRPWSGPLRFKAFFVAAFALAGFTFLLSHVESRFLYTVIPFIIPWMAEGWTQAEDWLLSTFGQPGRSTLRGRTLVGALGVVVVGLTAAHMIPVLGETKSVWAEHRNLGIWIRENLGEGRTIMAATPVVSFYAGGGFEVLPYARLDRVLRYARHKEVEYLVVERDIVETFRPQLGRLLNPSRKHEDLELTHFLAERTGHAIYLYRISYRNDTAR